MDENPFENVALFVVKLWKMLSRPEAVDILSWDCSGKSFVIHNQVQFATNLLPIYFKHNNVNSFVRQLNSYDFHKISFENKGNKFEYQHEYFQRDRPDLLVHIKRKLPQLKMGNKENSEGVKNLSQEMIDALKNQQKDALRRIHLLQQENASLAKEIAFFNARNDELQKILRRLIEIFEKSCKYESDRMARADCIEPRCLVIGSLDGYNNFMDLRDLIRDQPMELTDLNPNTADMSEEILKDLDDLENDISLLQMSKEPKK